MKVFCNSLKVTLLGQAEHSPSLVGLSSRWQLLTKHLPGVDSQVVKFFMADLLTKSRLISEVKASLFLAIPLAGAQLAQAATGFIDTVMMGWLGSQTLAAGGLGATAFTALLIVTTNIISAVSPLVAAAYGAGKVVAVGRVVRQGLWLAVTLAIPVMLFLWHADLVLRLLGQKESSVVLSQTYLRAIVWGFLPALGFAVLRNFVSALSEPRPVIVIMVSGTCFNVVANYVLMFGKLGLPALGLAGIGWASTLALWSMFIALTLYIMKQQRYRAYKVFHGLHQFEGQVFRELVHLGLPIGILAAVETGLFTTTTILMGQLGTVTLAAHQIALQTAAVTFMVPLGISFATTIRVGQLLGAGDGVGARLAGYVGIGMSALFMSVTGVLFWTMPERIVSLYLNIHDPVNREVVHLAEALLGVAAMFQLFDGIQVSATGALRGLKDTRVPMLIGIIAYWGIGLTSGYILGLQLGLGGVGLWWGLASGLAAAAAVLTWRFGTTKLQGAIPPLTLK
jgi:MATE family multidrug resistance protein